jgi:uncharacterized PurR-regulated membrane protein YhhQ (DUF165 family)
MYRNCNPLRYLVMVSRALLTVLSIVERHRDRARQERGQSVLEYIVLSGVLIVAAGVAAYAISGAIHTSAQHVVNSLNTPVTGTP